MPFSPSSSRSLKCGGVVDAVLVEDQRVGQRADLQQPVPVGGVARQARDLQPEHDAGAPQADLGDQLLEAVAVDRARPPTGPGRLSMTTDALQRPAQRDRALSRSAYWRSVLSVFSKTCRSVDCRT